ncbi:MAG: flagellin [Phenylobacterium sp.]|uniref:flagellin n=1 Tax=Phenylobacterium sp. TaxID=1871053 RepID=UPI001B3F4FEC|nr:flagellin [Phenylobacterium sp.]MBP7648778.1 flagellin [Phenylobacterium sp.]MBP7815896.1 flagellin [Phenylobacterium sp.]MBP9232582.1 flagellin [Phenylobacterium sp.]MBP9755153.1 flagellin [Phenylobacterium sp.]
MSISVHTNKSALVALQNLNKTNDELSDVQNRINTGLSIANAKDNASVWSIAQGQRADIGALAAVKMSLDRAQSIAEVSMAAGESISDLLVQLKEKVVSAQDPSLDANSRTALDADFKSILRQISQVGQNANFDGADILDGTTTSIRFLANADANAYITLSGQDMSLGGAIITIAPTASINTVADAQQALTDLDASIGNVNQALGALGAQAKQIENHNKFVSKLTDVLQAGIGNLVDADVAKESAHLQALQVQQQLGAQALSIANQAPQIILSLFK